MAFPHRHPLPNRVGRLGQRRRFQWALLLTAGLVSLAPAAAWSQSQILESVKRNPGKAKAICAQLRQMNAQGISYTSRQATRQIADQEGLSPADAEVLTTYVVGLHCTDVR